jgi:hypothetical protein
MLQFGVRSRGFQKRLRSRYPLSTARPLPLRGPSAHGTTLISKFRVEEVFAFRQLWNMDLEKLNTIPGSLKEKGYAIIRKVLSRTECEQIVGSYDDPTLFRTTINMERFRFGKGTYKYFAYPLPATIQVLREEFYKSLCDIANLWHQHLDLGTTYPPTHAAFLEVCKSKGQLRPTPLILKYEAGGFNTLHQDLYGDVYFPFQVMIALTQHGRDHEGGEFVLTEQIPRAQSRAEVIVPDQGDAVVFTTNYKPVKYTGERGRARVYYRARIKHGVSEIKSGVRYALGIIFHDAS